MQQYIVKKNPINNEKIIYLIEEKKKINIALSSQRSAQKEAERILAHSHNSDQKPTMIVILGAGNHYLLHLAKKKNMPIAVVAHDKKLVELAESLLKKEEKSNLVFFDGESKKEMVEKIVKFFHCFPNAGRQILFLKNQREVQLQEEFFTEIKKNFIAKQNEKSINRSTFKRFEKIWLKNMVKNTVNCIKSMPIGMLKDIGKGQTAIVIGAGPSLQLDLDILKKKQNNFFLIAVDTAIKPLLSNGITVDVVVSVDPQKINSRYLENLEDPRYKKGKELYKNALLLAEPAVCARSLRNFSHVAMFDTFFPFYKFISTFFGIKGAINSGGSVISTAYELVRIMKFDTLIFCGVDLSFFLDSYHLKGSMYEDYWLENIDRFSTYEMKINQLVNQELLTKEKNLMNETVFTDSPMKLYRNWLEERASEKDFSQCINTSKTGIKLKKMEHMTLEEAYQKIKKNEKNLMEEIRTLSKKYKDWTEEGNENPAIQEKWEKFWKATKEIRFLLWDGEKKLEKKLQNAKKALMSENKEKKIWLEIEKLKKTAKNITKHIIVGDLISAVMQETIHDIDEKNENLLATPAIDEKKWDYFFDFYEKMRLAMQFNRKMIERFLFT